ncbi:hypothetical protein BDK51DRAFT_38629 [Blyttiomyces helicus]|uniref:Uncharacterized protein n=1 Tax=Blyttiomyces helicus TaxID=388810 RepID=A0A4P9W6T6_9FUNG|nr:hypothetical protein BDK51DRAFT_38629 [Blyttiomyces helicus]|eukprot:RKO88181.1 hypothetical protein BDK51DRAFT_38629 [Blyttiomyces helicus]
MREPRVEGEELLRLLRLDDDGEVGVDAVRVGAGASAVDGRVDRGGARGHRVPVRGADRARDKGVNVEGNRTGAPRAAEEPVALEDVTTEAGVEQLVEGDVRGVGLGEGPLGDDVSSATDGVQEGGGRAGEASDFSTHERLGVGVHEGHSERVEVIGVDLEGAGGNGAIHGVVAGVELGDGRVVAGADDGDERLVLGDDDLLEVDAGVDKNQLLGGREVRDGVDAFLHSAEDFGALRSLAKVDGVGLRGRRLDGVDVGVRHHGLAGVLGVHHRARNR